MTNTTPIHSVRMNNHVWDTAKRRANGEGLSMNAIISRYVGGYAAGAPTPEVVPEYEDTLLQRSRPRTKPAPTK